MLLAFLVNLKGILADEIDEPLPWNDFVIADFYDLEPAAVDPTPHSSWRIVENIKEESHKFLYDSSFS